MILKKKTQTWVTVFRYALRLSTNSNILGPPPLPPPLCHIDIYILKVSIYSVWGACYWNAEILFIYLFIGHKLTFFFFLEQSRCHVLLSPQLLMTAEAEAYKISPQGLVVVNVIILCDL